MNAAKLAAAKRQLARAFSDAIGAFARDARDAGLPEADSIAGVVHLFAGSLLRCAAKPGAELEHASAIDRLMQRAGASLLPALLQHNRRAAGVAVQAAIDGLRARGRRVDVSFDVGADLPRLYRIDDGPELTEAQLLQAAVDLEATAVAIAPGVI
jgi:hypothetical protein